MSGIGIVKWAAHGRYEVTCSECGPIGVRASQFDAQTAWADHAKTHERQEEGERA